MAVHQLKAVFLLAAAVLAGCVSAPEQGATQGNSDLSGLISVKTLSGSAQVDQALAESFIDAGFLAQYELREDDQEDFRIYRFENKRINQNQVRWYEAALIKAQEQLKIGKTGFEAVCALAGEPAAVEIKSSARNTEVTVLYGNINLFFQKGILRRIECEDRGDFYEPSLSFEQRV